MAERPLEHARDLFIRYDGSSFYMSRDGADIQYQRYAVPNELEQKWLEEITTNKLDMLGTPGNWRVVHFYGATATLATCVN